VTSEYGVAGLSSGVSRGWGISTSPVEGTGVVSLGVEETTAGISFSVCDMEKVGEVVAGGGGAFGSDISRSA
jgi:hypothetical protein